MDDLHQVAELARVHDAVPPDEREQHAIVALGAKVLDGP